MTPGSILQSLYDTGRRIAHMVLPHMGDSGEALQPLDSGPAAPDVSPAPVYSKLKLAQVASDCGSTVAADQVGRLLADPKYSFNSIAAALSTTPVHLAQALAKPEPIVYPPLVIT